jgi:hypothetical protein
MPTLRLRRRAQFILDWIAGPAGEDWFKRAALPKRNDELVAKNAELEDRAGRRQHQKQTAAFAGLVI